MRALRLLTTCTLTTALLVGTAAAAQTASSDTSKPAANAWMLTPTRFGEWNKDVSPSLRAQRDRHWDEVTHRERPLTVGMEGALGVGVGGPDYGDDGKRPEIPDVPDRAILTATFRSHRSVLSASEKSIYTEITMRVQQVYEDKTPSGNLAPHQDITLMLIGGTVALSSGRMLSDHVQPLEKSLQPERSYLLVLQYHKEGDWYGLKEDWDITDGVVRANTRWGQYLAGHGRSRLNELALEQLGTVLSEELYAPN